MSASSVADRFAEAFNSRDVERVLAVFTSDAVYHDLCYGRFDGHAGLRALFTRMYAEGSQHEWRMRQAATGPDVTIGEWQFEFTLSSAVRHGAGRTLAFPGVSVFETRQDLCCTYREYFDRTAALLAVGIAPATVAGIVTRRPSVRVRAPGPQALSG